MPSAPPPHLPRWLRSAEGLPLPRLRGRISSYLYGNILVLAAVLASTPEALRGWMPFITVAATTLTTFLAHVVAHSVGAQLGRTEADTRLHLRAELRDAVPILSSGVIPLVILMLGAWGVLFPVWAESLSATVLIGRIALTGIMVERMSANRSPLVVVWTGLVVAFVSLVIVALKLVLLH